MLGESKIPLEIVVMRGTFHKYLNIPPRITDRTRRDLILIAVFSIDYRSRVIRSLELANGCGHHEIAKFLREALDLTQDALIEN